jgi:small subunit ribosomal protein S6
MFLVDASDTASHWDEMMAQIQTIFQRAHVEVINMRKWDDRRLCYEIKGHKRGMYILSYFKAEPGVIGQIERDVQISERVLRVLILRVDHMTEKDFNAPTPLMLQENRGPSEPARQEAAAPDAASIIEEIPYDVLEDAVEGRLSDDDDLSDGRKN